MSNICFSYIGRVNRLVHSPKISFVRWLYKQLDAYEQKRSFAEKETLKAKLKYCGSGVRLNGRVKITVPEKVTLKNNVHIGDGAFINGRGGLEIGENTHISRNLVLYTINHNYQGQRLPYDENYLHKPVVIGRNVWIGMNVTIAPGTTIGDGAIIGLGTTLFGDIPALAIIGSATWSRLGFRDYNHYHQLDTNKQFGGVNGLPFDLYE